MGKRPLELSESASGATKILVEFDQNIAGLQPVALSKPDGLHRHGFEDQDGCLHLCRLRGTDRQSGL
jgi:hypothetical protein